MSKYLQKVISKNLGKKIIIKTIEKKNRIRIRTVSVQIIMDPGMVPGGPRSQTDPGPNTEHWCQQLNKTFTQVGKMLHKIGGTRYQY